MKGFDVKGAATTVALVVLGMVVYFQFVEPMVSKSTNSAELPVV